MKTLKRNSGILYVLPSFVLILLFSIIPLFMSGYYSFTRYNVINSPTWIGMQNYQALMKDQFFMASVKNTLIYTVFVVPIQTILAMVLADVVVNRFRNRFGNIVRSALFIPVISSMILVGTVWKFLLATDNGLINNIISLFGIQGPNWLGTKTLAMVSVCLVSIWKNVGYFLVIFYAGLMDIPRSYYEAAEVDGATRWQRFWYITVPCLKPITYLVITLGTIWSFQVFDLVYTMTGGGPGRSTLTLVLIIYQYAFQQYKMGYACAVSLVLFVIVLLITFVQKIVFRGKEE